MKKNKAHLKRTVLEPPCLLLMYTLLSASVADIATTAVLVKILASPGSSIKT